MEGDAGVEFQIVVSLRVCSGKIIGLQALEIPDAICEATSAVGTCRTPPSAWIGAGVEASETEAVVVLVTRVELVGV